MTVGLIRARPRLIRGEISVVSFTELPPDAAASAHVFRAWLHRWDFEPYAIGIRWKAALDMGVKPVVYRASADYASIPDDDRWLFQKQEPPRVDFANEREWRHLGDVNLAALNAADWVVYHEEAVAK